MSLALSGSEPWDRRFEASTAGLLSSCPRETRSLPGGPHRPARAWGVSKWPQPRAGSGREESRLCKGPAVHSEGQARGLGGWGAWTLPWGDPEGLKRCYHLGTVATPVIPDSGG
jgi:hypothetical protein